MSKAVSGYVNFVGEKEWKGRNGMVTLYSFRIEGDDTYYRTGQTNPEVAKGQFVKFTANDQNVDMSSIQRGDVKQEAPATKAQGNVGNRNDYWVEKDRYDKEVVQPRIAYCAARRDAIAITKALFEGGILKPATKANERVPGFLAVVAQVTDDLLTHQIEVLEGGGATAAQPEEPTDEDIQWGDD